MVFIATMTKENLAKKLFFVAERIHLRVFGHAMSDEMRRFLGHLSWSFLGGIVAAGIMFAVNILAGRWLGPEEYGKYVFILVTSGILVNPMLGGVDIALQHFLPQSQSLEESVDLLSSALLFVLVSSVLWVVFVIFIPNQWFDFLNTQRGMIIAAVLFSAMLAVRVITDSVLKGSRLFRYQVSTKALESSLALLFLLYFWISGPLKYSAVLYSLIVSYLVVSGVVVMKVRKMIRLSFKKIPLLLSFGKLTLLSSFSGLVLSAADKMLLGRYNGFSVMGVYAAYYAVSVSVVNQVVSLFVSVFFPHASTIAVGDSKFLIRKLRRLLVVSSPIVFLCSLILITISIKLLGDRYPFDLVLLLEFGALSVLSFLVATFSWFLNSRGILGVWMAGKSSLIAGGFFILTVFILRGLLNSRVMVALLILTFAIWFLILASKVKKYESE